MCPSVLLQKQLNSSTVAVQDLQTLLEQTSAALVASQARLKETHTSGAAAAADSSSGSSGSRGSSSPGRSAALQEEIRGLKVRMVCVDSEVAP